MLRTYSRTRFGRWLLLGSVCATGTGCIVNPVPTPEKTSAATFDKATDSQTGGTVSENDSNQAVPGADATGAMPDATMFDIAADVTVDMAGEVTTDVGKL